MTFVLMFNSRCYCSIFIYDYQHDLTYISLFTVKRDYDIVAD